MKKQKEGRRGSRGRGKTKKQIKEEERGGGVGRRRKMKKKNHGENK